MKTAVPLAPMALVDARGAEDSTWAVVVGKSAAFLALTKPRIGLMVLLTTAVGYVMGVRQVTVAPPPETLWFTLLGTGLVAGGASAWNQYLERRRDDRMRRTAARPLPTGRVSPAEAVTFGTLLALVGLAILAFGPGPLAASVAVATFVLYVGVYTPLKLRTTLNTAIGAIPGALPPVIGWASATGRLGIESWALFLIVFLWQFPHFLAIAWIYRDDYLRAGYRMLPSVDPLGSITGRQAVGHALALIPVGLLPTVVGLAGPIYFVGALVLGLIYLEKSIRFWSDVSDANARRLLRASFLYLPLVLVLLLISPPMA